MDNVEKWEEKWEDHGGGVQILRKSAQHVTISALGLQALECISAPLALFDPFANKIAWMNSLFKTKFSRGHFVKWVEACNRVGEHETGPLATLIHTIKNVCEDGGSADIYIPKQVSIPYLHHEMPFAWTLHCHSVSLARKGSATRLVTLQIPAMVEPPRQETFPTETTMDRIVGLIDRSIDAHAGRNDLLGTLRQRLLDGRLNEPLFASDLEMSDHMSWDSSASLAMMLGIPLDATDHAMQRSATL